MQIKTNIKNLENYKKYLLVINAIKEYLDKQDYLEIDLPVLSPTLVPESYLEIFQTAFQYYDKKKKLFLTPSPELFLKRILAYGRFDCYYLGKSFRNCEAYSDLHSFEFTMLEFYKTKANCFHIADELLGMMQYIAKKLFQKNKIVYQNKVIDLTRWEKLSVCQAFSKYADIDADCLFDRKTFLKKAGEKGYRAEGFDYEDLFSQIYTQEIEPNLGINGCPTLLYNYPKEFAALAKLNPDGRTSQRFEFYVAGIELGDCYTELTDWREQQQRFTKEDKARKKSKKIKHPVDQGFIQALKHGLVDCAGVAIGVERLAMVFSDVVSIHDLKLIDVY